MQLCVLKIFEAFTIGVKNRDRNFRAAFQIVSTSHMTQTHRWAAPHLLEAKFVTTLHEDSHGASEDSHVASEG